MGYGYDPNSGPGRTNNAPIGGPIERGLRNYAERPKYDGSRKPTYSGGNPFKTYDFDHEVNTIGNWDSTRDFERGLADFVGSVSDQFFPGKYQVNTGAYQDISGSPYRDMASMYNNRALPGSQVQQGQMDLIQMLQNQANGTGPSLAHGMLRQGTDRNVAQTMGMMASARGPGAAGSAYNAAFAGSQANQAMAGDASQLRLQEQLQARGLLGSVLGQTRGQDIEAQAQQDSLVQEYIKMGYSADQANREAALKMEELKMKAFNGPESSGGFLGGLFSSLSDETAKKEIKSGSKDLYSFLDKLEPHNYKYKDEKNGKGKRVSVMAQELEKSKLGEEFVFERTDGKKGVDYGKGLGTMLAAQAMLHKRLKKLEKRHG